MKLRYSGSFWGIVVTTQLWPNFVVFTIISRGLLPLDIPNYALVYVLRAAAVDMVSDVVDIGDRHSLSMAALFIKRLAFRPDFAPSFLSSTSTVWRYLY